MHDDYVFVLMIITLIKMVNVDALSSHNVKCSWSNSHTFVDLYLFMWRETVDFRMEDLIFCLHMGREGDPYETKSSIGGMWLSWMATMCEFIPQNLKIGHSTIG